MLSNVSTLRASFTHYLQDDPLVPLAVKFRVEDSLPGSEIQPSFRDWDDHLVMDEQSLQMGIPVVFAGVMMLVVLSEGRKVLQPLVDVLDQPALVVVHVNAGGDVHGGNEDHAFGDTAVADGALNLRSDVDVLAVLLRRNVKYSV